MLGDLFPNCITESKDGDETIQSVDFDALRQELSDYVVEGPKERYLFTWPDKNKARLLSNTPTTMTLRPCREESVDFDNTDNIYIEGDNLEVLKILRETYLGKVKMIYIDPPYNTGNNFIYKDNFKVGSQDYAPMSGDYNDQGDLVELNQTTNGRFHTDWLNTIYPVIQLGRDLLSDDGVFFVSMDEGESANLRKVCDEIFGERNFIVNFIWRSRTSISNDYEVSLNHNHTLVYSKNRDCVVFGGDVLDANEYKNPDSDPRGPWKLVPLDANHAGGNTYYPIRNPKTNVDYYPPNGRIWSYNEDTMNELILDGRVKFGMKDNSAPKRKLYLNERIDKGDLSTPSSLLLDAGTTKDGTIELMSIFDNNKLFDYPKPTSLIERLICYGAPKGGIILDYFAGSGTTGNATINRQLNSDYKYSYIIVQLPENLDDKYSKAKDSEKAMIQNQLNYLDSIGKKHILSEIGKERLRRVKNNVEAKNLTKRIDCGFRVYKLDTSNMTDVFYNPESYKQMNIEEFGNNVKPDRNPEDLLIQAMLDLGIQLSAKIETENIDSVPVFIVDDGYLVACLSDSCSEHIISTLAQRDKKPAYAIIRNGAGMTDQMLSNIEQIMKTYSPGTTVRLI